MSYNIGYNPNIINNYQMMQYIAMMNAMQQNANIPPYMAMNFNNQPNNDKVLINVYLNQNEVVQIQFSQQRTVEELTNKIKMDCKISKFFKLNLKGKNLVNSMTLAQSNIENGSNVYVIFLEDRFDDDTGYIKPIEMIFKNDNKSRFEDENVPNVDFINITKVCYLKEISKKLDDEKIKKFPKNI